MNNSITTKIKILNPVHEIFEALATPEKMAASHERQSVRHSL